MLRAFILLILLTFADGSAAQEALRLVNGQWYDGEGFVRREFYSVDGVLRTAFDGAASIVDLGGAWVVPGFGNAHTHGVGNQDFQAESQRFLRNGVFYVANPNSIASRVDQGRATFASAETVDAIFANGGLTSSGGHPIQIFEQEPGLQAMAGDAYWVIDDTKMLEEKWPAILATGPEFLKVYLEFSENHAERKDDPSFYGKRGLDPALIAPIVESAHEAGLRVAAHVASREDFRVAVAAGVDEIAHLPLEALTEEDASLAASSGVVLVTTALSHRPSPGVADLDALHQENLRLLRSAGVAMVLGTDSQASVVDEVLKLASFGVLDADELVRMLVVDTPRWVFPDRSLTFEDGAEASFVVLEANPLEGPAALREIDARFKAGRRVDITDEEKLPGIGQELVHTLMAQGTDAAVDKYHRLLESEPDEWDFSEGQLNALGDAMIQHGKAEAAVAIFGLNCEQFPESSNAFDSLGDAFVEIGNLEKARGSYEHALGLDPENDGSREKLAKIQD
jgi:hypothetical protein